MRFSPSFLDEIRDRVPISAIVGARVAWDRKKTNVQRGDYWGCCPFHGEKTPSFHCEDRKGRYHCFGCGVSGDHFRFLTELDGLSFPEAVERVAEMAGVAMPARDEAAEQRERQRASLTDVMELATNFFQQRLQAADGAKARAYLRERGLSSATQQAFRLGYAPDGRNLLKEFLASKGVGKDEIEACGLVVHGPDIPVSYDRFRDRITFPIEDSRGRVIAFGGRAMAKDAPAKYLNSNDTELFHKGNVLYNLARARKAKGPRGREDGTVIAVEGYMDVIALAQAGFDNVVAPLGTALTENQLELLWRMAGEPVLCFDGDQAGLKAAWRAADLALPLVGPGRTLRFALLPEGQDPDDLVRAGGPDAFREALSQARPLAELLWLRETSGGVFDTPERRAELERTLRELTGRIRDESVRRHYQQDMRERVQAFFGASHAGRRERGPTAGGPGRGGGGRQAAGRLAVTESLARSALVRSGGGPLPLRETAMLVAMVNHPVLLDDYADAFEEMNPAHPELKRLHGALLDAIAHGVAHERIALVEALAVAGHGDTWERAMRHCRGLGLWPVLGEAADEDAREAFSQTIALHARASELQRQRRTLQGELAEAVEREAEDVTLLLQAIAQINIDIASLERLEALVDGFGVSSGRG